MEPSQPLPGALFTVIFSLLIVVALVMVVAPVLLAHRGVRQSLADSPRQNSLLRWNLWTLGLPAMGSCLRIALGEREGLTAEQSRLMTWSRRLLFATTPLLFLSAAVRQSSPIAADLVDATSCLVAVVLYWTLRRTTENEELSDALSKVNAWFGGLFIAACLMGVSSLLELGSFLFLVVLGLLLISLFGFYVRILQTHLMMAILVHESNESLETRSGGTDTAYGVGLIVLWLVGYVVAALIGSLLG